MAASKLVSVLLLAIVTATIMNVTSTEATWCVARSSASYGALQSNLDWACSHGADCGPIQPGGTCFYPNTIQNHASYAFDSYYQRMRRAPGSCYFGGCATIAVTDPSFGRCTYPPLESASDGGADTSIAKPQTSNIESDTWVSRDARKKAQAQTVPVPDAQKL